METVEKDLLHRSLKWVSYNRNIVIGVVLTAMILLPSFACQSKTGSILSPGKQVTRQQLNMEGETAQQEIEILWATLESKMATYSSGLEAGHADLDAQDEQRVQVTSFLGGLATSAIEGTINPLQAVTSAVSLAALFIGGGAVLDNRRKDKVILQKDAIV